MKNKSKLCSTGHGTGVLQRATLGTILFRDKRVKLKKKREKLERLKEKLALSLP